MPAQSGRRSVARPLGIVAAGALGLASVAMIAAAPARSRVTAEPASAGRTLDIRLAEAPPQKLTPVSSSAPLDVRPVAIEAPVSPDLASAQAEADFRAQQAAEARQAEMDLARERRESARIDALLRHSYAPQAPEARDPGQAADEDDGGNDDA